MRDLLHDEVDALEDLREDARELVQRLKAAVLPLAKSGASVREILDAIAEELGGDLDGLTSKAVRSGYEKRLALIRASRKTGEKAGETMGGTP